MAEYTSGIKIEGNEILDLFATKQYLLDNYPSIITTGTNNLWVAGNYDHYKIYTSAYYNSTTITATTFINDNGVPWSDVTMGWWHTNAIKTDGTLWSWGSNTWSQLGTGDTITRSSPVQIGALTTWNKVFSNRTSTFATRQDGTAYGWGENLFGVLGLGDTTSRSSPVQLGSLNDWKQFSLSDDSVAALKADGTIWVWGRNKFGELGVLGPGADSGFTSSPQQVGALTGWADTTTLNNYYSNSFVNMFVRSDGTLWGWGANNAWSVLGSGNTNNYSSPIQIGALTNWKQIATSYMTMAAVKTDGTLWMSGDNGWWQLGGLGAIASVSSPVQVGTLTDWKQVSVSDAWTAAIKTDNTLWIWGYNVDGELGLGDVAARSSPVQVGTLANWKQVFVGGYHTLAVKTDGTLWAWGLGTSGQLGLGNLTSYSSPMQVGALTDWSYVHADESSTYAIKTDGSLWSWGSNVSGNLGHGDTVTRSSPVRVGALTWTHVTGGGGYTNNRKHVLAVRNDGTLWGWGSNHYGQVGNSTFGTSYSSPVQIGSATDWKYGFAMLECSGGIKTDGTLYTWGAGTEGFHGYSVYGTAHFSSPVQLATGNDWKMVSKGEDHTAAVKYDGTLWIWGRNGWNQLGLGTSNAIYHSSPVQVGSLTNWKYVHADLYNTLAVKTDGTLWAWGNNNDGRLGLGNTASRSSPTQVGIMNNWHSVISKGATSFAVKTDGSIWGWGLNTSGKLGTGNTTNYSSPVQIGSQFYDWKKIVTARTFYNTATLFIR